MQQSFGLMINFCLGHTPCPERCAEYGFLHGSQWIKLGNVKSSG